jgi:hypothetical protein
VIASAVDPGKPHRADELAFVGPGTSARYPCSGILDFQTIEEIVILRARFEIHPGHVGSTVPPEPHGRSL